MAARKTKLTVDWIVITTGHGSEAGGDPIGVVLRICRNSLEKYFTGSKFTDNSLILMRSQIFVVVLILNYVHPPGGWIYYFCFFRRPMSVVRRPASDVRRHAWFPLI